jgi:hypothetical protein
VSFIHVKQEKILVEKFTIILHVVVNLDLIVIIIIVIRGEEFEKT